MPLSLDLTELLAAQLSRQAAEPNMLSYKPNKPQERFHKSRRRKKLLLGGNRAGKTTGGVIEGLWWATKRHPFREEIRNYPYPIRGRMIGKDLDTVKKIIHNAIKRWVVLSDLRGGSWETAYVANERMLYFENGSTIEFRSYDQEVLQHAGISLHWIEFDEPPPEEIYKENLLRLMDTFSAFEGSGAFWMTYTPINGMDWTYYTLYKPALADPDSKTLVVHASVDDNSYISEEAKDEILDGLTENEIKIRRHGQYVQVSGLVFREFNPEAHCLDESQLHAFWGDSLLPPQNWEVYWSLDHGLNAPTAIYWHAVAPSGFVITFHEIYRRETLIKDFCDEIHEYERFLGRRPRLRTGDPAIKQRSGITGTSVLQEYAKHGIYIAVDSVPKDPSIGIVRMRQHMRVDPRTGKPRWQLYQCPNLTSELMDLHWERYINRTAERKNPKETVHKFNDHGFDSCKYLFTFMPTLTPEELGEKPKSSIGVGAEGSLSEVLAELDAPPQFNIGGFILLRVGSRETKWSDASLDDEFGFEEHD